GTKLVNIAQMFSKSGMLEIAWKTSGINSIAAMRNKTVGVWCCGNQFELFAALTKHGMDPTKNKGVKIFNQPFDMNAFLQGKIQAAAAMTYNELAQVLETKNPKTGKLYTESDRGWIYCRDHVQQCTNIVLANGPTLGKGHQLWQMNENNKLIWPNKLGIGVMDPAAFKRTAAIALKYKVIKKPATAAPYDTTEAKAALQLLKNKVKGIDVYGK